MVTDTAVNYAISGSPCGLATLTSNGDDQPDQPYSCESHDVEAQYHQRVCPLSHHNVSRRSIYKVDSLATSFTNSKRHKSFEQNISRQDRQHQSQALPRSPDQSEHSLPDTPEPGREDSTISSQRYSSESTVNTYKSSPPSHDSNIQNH